MDRELRNLRRELATVERGRGRRYPEALRQRIAGWARRRRGEGASLREISGDLGVSPEGLRRWSAAAAAPAAPTLRPIEVVAKSDSREHDREIRIVTPYGARTRSTEDELLRAIARGAG